MPDSTSAAGPVVPSDTIVFVPGMNHRRDDVSVDGVATRIARALDQRAATRSASFRVVAPRSETPGSGDARWIERLDGGAVTACVAVHVLPVLRPFVERFESVSPPRQLARVVAAMVVNFVRSIGGLTRNRKSRDARNRGVHLLYLGGWLALATVYAASLLVGTGAVVVAGIDAAVKAVAGDGSAKGQDEPAKAPNGSATTPADAVTSPSVALLQGWGATVAIWLGVAVALGKVARAVVPAGTVERIGANARAATVVCEVMSGRRDRGEAIGMVPGLLERLGERDGGHGRLHVVGYSFGAIALLDTFAVADASRARVLREVATLTTIGLPFDLVALLWPSHVESWSTGSPRPAAWINVTHAADPFGSESLMPGGREKPALAQPPTQTVDGAMWGQLPQRGIWKALTLSSSLLHESYWDRDTAEAVTCFDALVGHWFGAGRLLD